MSLSGRSPAGERPRDGDRVTRWVVIGFAIVEAVVIGWALSTGVFR
jgi:hypothetical protein